MTPSTRPEAAPPLAGARAAAVRGPVLAAAGASALAVGLLLRDPHRTGSWGECPFLVLTGRPCPGCGGLRAANDLLRGDVAAAVGSNAYAVLTIGLALVLWTGWLVTRIRGGRVEWGPVQARLGAVWLAGLVLFGAARLLVPALRVLQP